MCINCGSIKRFLCIIACKDDINTELCRADNALAAMERRKAQMIKANGKRRTKLMDLLIVKLILIIYGIAALCTFGVYFTLSFADAIDAQINQDKVERDHLIKMQQIEKSNCHAAEQLRGGK
jgi:hypothetical protein